MNLEQLHIDWDSIFSTAATVNGYLNIFTSVIHNLSEKFLSRFDLSRKNSVIIHLNCINSIANAYISGKLSRVWEKKNNIKSIQLLTKNLDQRCEKKPLIANLKF